MKLSSKISLLGKQTLKLSVFQTEAETLSIRVRCIKITIPLVRYRGHSSQHGQAQADIDHREEEHRHIDRPFHHVFGR